MLRKRFVLVLLLGCAMLARSSQLRGDTLITTSGKRYEGKVTVDGSTYILERAGGGKVRLPATMVREIVHSTDFEGLYQSYLKKADLNNQRHIEILLGYATKWGLTAERARLLRKLLILRWDQAKDDQTALDELTRWCREAAFKEGVEICENRRLELDFADKFASSQSDGIALAKLTLWCKEAGLDTQARQAAEAALRAAPNDPVVRGLLGYEQTTVGGWQKTDSPWRVAVVGAAIQPDYSEKLELDTIRAQTPRKGHQLAVVGLQFDARLADRGTLADRLKPAENLLSPEALAFMSGRKNALGNASRHMDRYLSKGLSRPSRLFLSSQVRLELADGESVLPVFTSAPTGDGATSVDGELVITAVSGPNTGVLRYVRGEDITAILVQPGHQVPITLVFPVPAGIKQATLRFFANAPTKLNF